VLLFVCGLRLSRSLPSWLSYFVFHRPADHRSLHSFPTRRSSDLLVLEFDDRRAETFGFFEWLRDLGVTSLLISEEPSLEAPRSQDRKSTRLNSSHGSISYAVFCLKKKNNNKKRTQQRRSRHSSAE